MISPHRAYALNQLVSASKLIASYPTAHEGLYAAYLGPLQRIDIDQDLLLDERMRLICWRSRILHDDDQPWSAADLMAALRRLTPSEVDELALELTWLTEHMTR